MQLTNPLGLIALIGIPILILVYIIKSKYTEQTVPSTFLWTLSERFIRRRNPLSRLAGIISLILQILAITLIAIIISRPVFAIEGGAGEYCFILDGSGSMNMTEGGRTRYDIGKDKISEIINSSGNGSKYTLISVGAETTVVYEDIDNKKHALTMLEGLNAVHSDVDYTDAIGVAQRIFNNNPSIKCYLVTDVHYASVDNMTLLRVGGEVENYSLFDLVYADNGDTVSVYGNIASYTSAGELTLSVYADGGKEAVMTETIPVPVGERSFELEVPISDFYSLEVRINEPDALSIDSAYVIYNVKSMNSYKTLLVTSNESVYLPYMLEKMSSADVTRVKPESYAPGGYGLYIFDSCTPATVPTDGAVWFINSTSTSEGSGFAYQREVELETGALLSMTDSTESLAATLTEGLYGTEIYITKYVRYGLYDKFTSLFTYNGDPIIFTGTNEYGNREVVFAFDLTTSNLALTTDFGVLVKNFLDFSFPPVLERTNYKSGETAIVNAPAGCELIRVDTPLGNVEFLDDTAVYSELLLKESGIYTLTMTVGGMAESYYIFSEAPECERNPTPTEERIGLQGEAVEGSTDGIYDSLTVFFIILAVIILADWMVYCYDKYQLR